MQTECKNLQLLLLLLRLMLPPHSIEAAANPAPHLLPKEPQTPSHINTLTKNLLTILPTSSSPPLITWVVAVAMGAPPCCTAQLAAHTAT